MAEGGVSAGYVQGQINNLRNELRGEIRAVDQKVIQLESWVRSEIARLEREMREIGDKIVGAINQQTAAIVGGVAANTVMIERLKGQVEDEFDRTLDKIDSQIESSLQIEVVKKIADASSVRSKLSAFVSDIRSRYEKSLFNAAANRELYNLNFRKIVDEYESKVHTIGEHIFEVRDLDIAPVLEAAKVPYELTHGLSIEMDMARLSARSQNLDETVSLLKDSRVNDILTSLDQLEDDLGCFALECEVPGENVELCVEAIVTQSETGSTLNAGLMAEQRAGDRAVNVLHHHDLGIYSTSEARARINEQLDRTPSRSADPGELSIIEEAASELAKQNLISSEARDQLADFLRSGKLKILGGQHGRGRKK